MRPESKLIDAALTQNPNCGVRFVDQSTIAKEFPDRLTSPKLRREGDGRIAAYETIDGSIVPELRDRLKSVRADRDDFENRIRRVKNGKEGDEAIFRRDPETTKTVLGKLTVDGDLPPNVSPGMRWVPTIHKGADDQFGHFPFTDDVRKYKPADGEPDKVRDQTFLRLRRSKRVVVPIPPGMVLKAQKKNALDPSYAGAPGIDGPISEEDLNTRPLLFEAYGVDAMVIATFNPATGEWVVDTMPHGDVSGSPWECKEHYGVNWITGVPMYKDDDGNVYAFRLDDHIDRSCRDAAYLGMKNVTPELVRQIIVNNAKANKKWIPKLGNPAGNRWYERLTGLQTNLAPKLAGAEREIWGLGTPVGPYKKDKMLRVIYPGKARPVPEKSAAYKVSANYLDAVKLVEEFNAALPEGKKKYMEALFADGERLQEGLAANLVARFGNIVVVPSWDHDDILKSVTAMGVIELCQKRGYDVQVRDLELSEIKNADELLLTGTAMKVRGIGRLDGTDGEVLFGKEEMESEMGELGTALLSDLEKIMSMTHEDPGLNAMMQKVA